VTLIERARGRSVGSQAQMLEGIAALTVVIINRVICLPFMTMRSIALFAHLGDADAFARLAIEYDALRIFPGVSGPGSSRRITSSVALLASSASATDPTCGMRVRASGYCQEDLSVASRFG
jgi:hypothetical protein